MCFDGLELQFFYDGFQPCLVQDLFIAFNDIVVGKVKEVPYQDNRKITNPDQKQKRFFMSRPGGYFEKDIDRLAADGVDKRDDDRRDKQKYDLTG